MSRQASAKSGRNGNEGEHRPIVEKAAHRQEPDDDRTRASVPIVPTIASMSALSSASNGESMAYAGFMPDFALERIGRHTRAATTLRFHSSHEPMPMPHTSALHRIRLSGLVLGLLLVTPAYAHDTVPKACLNANAVPTVVKQFDFSPEVLANYRARNPVLKNPPEDVACDGERSCGIVDDWHWANQLSQEFCAGATLQSLSPTQPSATPMPFVNLPAVFNSAREHHSGYSFRTGHLVGACVVCIEADVPVYEAPSLESSKSR